MIVGDWSPLTCNAISGATKNSRMPPKWAKSTQLRSSLEANPAGGWVMPLTRCSRSSARLLLLG